MLVSDVDANGMYPFQVPFETIDDPKQLQIVDGAIRMVIYDYFVSKKLFPIKTENLKQENDELQEKGFDISQLNSVNGNKPAISKLGANSSLDQGLGGSNALLQARGAQSVPLINKGGEKLPDSLKPSLEPPIFNFESVAGDRAGPPKIKIKGALDKAPVSLTAEEYAMEDPAYSMSPVHEEDEVYKFYSGESI